MVYQKEKEDIKLGGGCFGIGFEGSWKKQIVSMIIFILYMGYIIQDKKSWTVNAQTVIIQSINGLLNWLDSSLKKKHQ